MEDDIDIYEDLPSFGTKCTETFESSNEQNDVGSQPELKKQIAELTLKLENIQKLKETMETNMYSLLKTAKAEIARKDKMIDDLRKKLDDATFKRGMFSKANNSAKNKSGYNETLANAHQKLNNFNLSGGKRDRELLTTSSISDQTEDQEKKSSLIPVTLFGERLLKRMLEEQSMEVKDKQSSRHNYAGSTNRNSDNSMAESDKENGSTLDSNFCKTRENQSFTSTQCDGSEYVRNPLTASRNIAKDSQSNGENEVQLKPHPNPMLTANYTRKRTHEDTNEQTSVKRIRCSDQEYYPKAVENEQCENLAKESKENNIAFRYNNLETSTNLCETIMHNVKDSNIMERSSKSNAELKNHGNIIEDVNRIDEKTYAKDKSDAQRDKRDTAERTSKRREKSAHNSTFTSGERDTSNRFIESLNKDDYRANYKDYHRSKQRAHQRIDDHRSRVKSTSYTKYPREDKCDRSQYNKHSNYDSRFEKRYNFRGSDADKAKQAKKDSYGTHCTTKRSILNRISTNHEKISDTKRKDTHNEHESRKQKVTLDRSSKEDRKHKYNGNVYHKSGTEKVIEHQSKCSEVSRRSIERFDQPVAEFTRNAFREVESATDKGLEKYANEELEKLPAELEDGEILNTPNSSPQKDVKGEGSKDEQKRNERNAFGDSDRSSEVDNTLTTYQNQNTANIEMMKEVKLCADAVSQPRPALSANVASTRDEINPENMESVENVENIEKFIRDSASTCGKTIGKISRLSDTIRAKNLAESKLSKAEDTSISNDIRDGEPITEELSAPFSNANEIVSLAENCKNEETHDDVTASDIEGKRSSNETQTKSMVVALRCTEGNLSPKERIVPNESGDNLLENASCESKTMTRASSMEKHLVTSERVNEKNENGSDTNNAGNDNMKSDHSVNSSHSYSQKQIDRNDCSGPGMTKPESQNVSLIVEATNGKETGKCTAESNETRLEDFEKGVQKQSSNKNAKDAPTNVQGKIVVFARRKKPVCLANSNANMTVLINN